MSKPYGQRKPKYAGPYYLPIKNIPITERVIEFATLGDSTLYLEKANEG